MLPATHKFMLGWAVVMLAVDIIYTAILLPIVAAFEFNQPGEPMFWVSPGACWAAAAAAAAGPTQVCLPGHIACWPRGWLAQMGSTHQCIDRGHASVSDQRVDHVTYMLPCIHPSLS
jgi:hypothetical protein